MTFALDLFAPTTPAPTGGSVRAEGQDAGAPDTAFADKVADATAARGDAPNAAAEPRAHGAKGHLLAPGTRAEATAGADETIAPATSADSSDTASVVPPVITAPETVETQIEGDASDATVEPQPTPVIASPPPAVQAAPTEAASSEASKAAVPTPVVAAPETPDAAPDQPGTAAQGLAAEPAASPAPDTTKAAPKPEAAIVRTPEAAATPTEQPTPEAGNDQAASARAVAETLKAATAPPPATPPVATQVAAQIAAQIAALARPAAKPAAAGVAETPPVVEEPATPAQASAPETARSGETPRPVAALAPSVAPAAPSAGREAISNAAAADPVVESAAAPAPDASGVKVDTAANTPVPPPAPSATPPAVDPVVAVTTDATVEVAAETPRAAVTASTEAARTLSMSQLSQATVETTAQIAAQIVRRLEGRSTRFDMVLTPEDLGRVEVRLEIDSDGQLAARLAFDNPAAATDLRGRADELRRQLQDAGFQLADNALEFSQRDTSSGGGFDRRQDRNALFAGGSRLAAQADAAAAPAAWINLALTPDRVDMKV